MDVTVLLITMKELPGAPVVKVEVFKTPQDAMEYADLHFDNVEKYDAQVIPTKVHEDGLG